MENYQQIRVICQAIYGPIILCRNKEDGCFYAIKRLDIHHMRSKRAITGRTVSEDGYNELCILRRIQKLQSPDLVSLHDEFVQDKCLFLVFPYYPNGDVLRIIQFYPKKRLPEAYAKTIFLGVLSGLKVLHALGIAHRDLSLENILVDKNYHGRICDFGLGALDGEKCFGSVGKRIYAAPEVFKNTGGPYNGFLADVWSLGIILFIMLTGNPPFEAPSSQDARFRILSKGGPKALLKIWRMDSLLSAESIDLLQSILHIRPSHRMSIYKISMHGWICSESGPENQAKH